MTVSISYENDKVVEESDGDLSLLQISLKNGIPHQHACGGQARCSTCRVRIVAHPENVLPRNAAETKLAERKHFDESIRLACQTRVRGPVKIQRLVLDEEDVSLAMSVDSGDARLRTLAVMFSDLRNFTNFSEAHLPYDTVHILNRYFHSVGDAILRNHGHIDKYMGDGIMALFGLKERDPAAVCRNAVQAGLQMLQALKKLNRYLGAQFRVEFKMGVGIHFGEVIVGNTGHPRKKQFTAIGDSVNFASRIESATKQLDSQFLVSQAVRDILGDQLETARVFHAPLKGKSGVHTLFEPLRLVPSPQRPGQSSLDRLRAQILRALPLKLAPAALHVAVSDALSYDPATKFGGARGGIRFWEPDGPWKETIASGLGWLKSLKRSHPEQSWADLIALSGAAAVEMTGGPAIPVELGRTDCEGPTRREAGLTLEAPIAVVKRRFLDAGFTLRELVALMGARTLGIADGAPVTDDFLVFSGTYFQALLESLEPRDPRTAKLPAADKALVDDLECRRFVQEYAFDEPRFHSDFACVYRKLSVLGTGLDEA